ncbi:glycoside hydrolase family 16 protein [Sphingobacterium populi]|uniref:Family 16 glycosylhydrolase n=2 Tax=Sphingobacterium TaxID=28453 RepID=A0ABW5UD34_9SPHI
MACRKPDLNIEGLPTVVLPPQGYTLAWEDEFDKALLDSTKWSFRQLGRRRSGFNTRECIIPNEERGTLTIRTFLRNDSIFTGMIGTQEKFEQQYGYFECSARISQIAYGYWAAFWLQSPDIGKTLNPEVDGVEIDIMEFVHGYPYQVSQAIHWNGYAQNHMMSSNNILSDSRFDGAQYHLYSMEWTPDYYRFFVDRRMVWEVRGPISHREQYMILSCEVGDRLPFINTFGNTPVDFEIDYVRVYKKE